MDVEHPLDVHAHSGARRCRRVVDVAADEQCVGLLLVHDVGQLPQEVALLLAAVIAVEILAQVPVTGMNESEHADNRFLNALG